jgi:sortase A
MSLRDAVSIRGLQAILLSGGALCLLWVAYHSVEAATFRHTHVARIEAALALPDDAPGRRAAVADSTNIGPDGVLGVLEIPRLGVSEVVASGDSDTTLKKAIGHLADTPLPWAGGNSVFAAHRDTHFRELRHIRFGDVIHLKTAKGVLEYRVTDRMIVDPTDLWVLAPSKKRRLTLITCYPFGYVGAAPQRFIVIADAR